MHGMGSWSSPIVISDDEDEAYVELELERRLSSPRGQLDADYDDWFDADMEEEEDAVYRRLWGMSKYDFEEPPEDESDEPLEDEIVFDLQTPVSAGQKRKRTVSDASASVHPRPRPPALPINLLPLNGPAVPSAAPKKESKNQKKKRRKREEAERMKLLGILPAPQAGPSSAVRRAPPMSHPPPLSSSNSYSRPPSIPFVPSASYTLPMKPLFVTPHLPYAPLPPPMPTSHLPPSSAFLAPQLHPFPLVSMTYPSNSMPLPQIMPMPEPGPSTLPPAPRSAPQPKGTIGRSDEDPKGQHGTYTLLKGPVPDATRTLVMEPLPKRYRREDWIRSWAEQFGPSQQTGIPRIEVDLKNGKALIEFTSVPIASAAFDSRRLHGDGKEHIRVWWYKVSSAGASRELEEGEIDEEETHVKAKKAKFKVNTDMGKVARVQQHPVPAMAAPQYSSQVRATASVRVLRPLPSGPAVLPHSPSGSSSLPTIPILPSQVSRPLPAPESRSSPPPITPVFPSQVVRPTRGQEVSNAPQQPFPQPHATVDTNDRATSMDIGSDDGIVEKSLSNADAQTAVSQSERTMDDDKEPISPEPLLVEIETPDLVHTPIPSVAKYPMTSALATKPSALLLSPVETEQPTVLETTTTVGPSPPAMLVRSTSTTIYPLFEPRATRNLRRHSRVKQNLHIRQKELEEEVARNKEDLASQSGTTTPSRTSAEPVAEAFVPTSTSMHTFVTSRQDQKQGPTTTTAPEAYANGGTVAREENLRRLVLESKRTRMAAGAVVESRVAVDGTYIRREQDVPSPPTEGHMPVPLADVSTKSVSLSNLAVSFITDSVKAVSSTLSSIRHPTPPPAPPSLPAPTPAPMPMSEKDILAAKQRLLEKNIANVKDFLTRLSTASCKAARDEIRKEMKASNRAMDEEMKSLTLAAERYRRRSSGASTPRMRWPDMTSCVLIISDDESDGEDTD